MKTVKLLIEIELDGNTVADAKEAVVEAIRDSYYSVLAAEVYDPSRAERAAFLVLDDAFIHAADTARGDAFYRLPGGWDALHKKLVAAMDPIESAKRLAAAKGAL